MDLLIWAAGSFGLGLLSKVVNYATNTKNKKEDQKKIFLIPPLFERQYNPNASLLSPLQNYQLCRKSLFENYYTPSDKLLFAQLHLAPHDSHTHDLLTQIYFPRPKKNFTEAHLPELNPQARAVLQIVPDQFNKLSINSINFMQIELDTHKGGFARVAGAYSLIENFKFFSNKNSTESLKLNNQVDLYERPTSETASALKVPLSEPIDKSTNSLSLIGYAPIFQSTPQSIDTSDVMVGLRLDQSQGSLGIISKPYQGAMGGWIAMQSQQFMGGVEAKFRNVECSQRPDVSLDYSIYYMPSTAYGLADRIRPNYQLGLQINENGDELVASYFHHLCLRRRVFNPLERTNVVGISSYLDLGFELKHRKGIEQPKLTFGAAYQLNKASLFKAKLSEDAVSGAVVCKSWGEPNAIVALTGSYSLKERSTKVGVSLSLENVGKLLFGSFPTAKRTVPNIRKDVTQEVIVRGDGEF